MRTTTGTKNKIKQFEGYAWKRMYVPREYVRSVTVTRPA